MKRICVITSTRADYGLLKALLKEIKKSEALNLQLVVSGAHLSPIHGLTIREIEQDNLKIDAKVSVVQKTDDVSDICNSISEGIKGFSKVFENLNPDILLVLGDRYEILSAAIAATIANIPIAHLHGGEVTIGAYDEGFRHAITKMSHLHFVAAKEYQKRVIQLGENPSTVFCVGGLGTDSISRTKLFTKEELSERLGIEFDSPMLLVTYHPVTLYKQDCFTDLSSLLKALDYFKGCKILFTMPNADTDGLKITKKIKNYVGNNKNTYFVSSLGQKKYFSCLNYFDALIGNSSSGLLEAPSFKIPAINIGPRQKGRLKAESVIDCEANEKEIRSAIEKGLSNDFKINLRKVKNPYGDGGASDKIINILENSDFSNLSMKTFFDINF